MPSGHRLDYSLSNNRRVQRHLALARHRMVRDLWSYSTKKEVKMKFKRWLFPVASAVVLLIILLLFYLAAEPHSHDTGYGALAIMMNGLIFCHLVRNLGAYRTDTKERTKIELTIPHKKTRAISSFYIFTQSTRRIWGSCEFPQQHFFYTFAIPFSRNSLQ